MSDILQLIGPNLYIAVKSGTVDVGGMLVCVNIGDTVNINWYFPNQLPENWLELIVDECE